MFGTFYQFISNDEYTRAEANKPRERSRDRSRSKNPRRDRDNQARSTSHGRRDRGPSYGRGEDAGGGADGGYGAAESGKDGDDWPDDEGSGTDAPGRPYKQVKHIFEIKVKELRNIPVLNKFIV